MKVLLLSFKYAVSGIWFCVKTCRNFRIHLVAAAYILYFKGFYELDRTADAVIFSVIALVLMCEGINCALEQVCNACTEGYNDKIKHAKDAAAGAVLTAALFSVAVGIEFFWQPEVLRQIFNFVFGDFLRLCLFILSLIISVLFIFCKDIFKNEKGK
ncbi:MAG: diacylglycerol kinase family protein [Clostridia bacterium]|nr:diacylglycerol kinase family protein [Clostridia bacterium]